CSLPTRRSSDLSLLTVLRIAEEELGPDDYGLESVLDDRRLALSSALFEELRERYAAHYEATYVEARFTVRQFVEAGLPLPRELRTAVELALDLRFADTIEAAPVEGFDRAWYENAVAIADEALRFGCRLSMEVARRHLDEKLIALARRVCAGATDETHAGAAPADAALELLEVAERLGVDLDVERPQELLYAALERSPTPAVRLLARALGLRSEAPA